MRGRNERNREDIKHKNRKSELMKASVKYKKLVLELSTIVRLPPDIKGICGRKIRSSDTKHLFSRKHGGKRVPGAIADFGGPIEVSELLPGHAG